MNRSFLFGTLAALFVVTILAGLYFGKPNPLAERVKALESELTRTKADYTKLQTAYDKLSSIAPGAPPASPATTKAATSASGPAFTEVSTTSSDAAVKRAVDSSKTTHIMDRFRENQIDLAYSQLIRQFGLNPEESAFFKKLLFERQTLENDVLMARMDPNSRPDDSKIRTKKIAAIKEQSNESIRQFLNNEEDYQAFLGWEDSKLERQQLQMALPSFDSADALLSSQQREQLVDIMVTTRKNNPTSKFKKDPNSSLSGLDQVRLRQEKNDQQILQQAASFLTPEQLAVLESTQAQRRKLYYPQKNP